jgi:uncharacterized iron-regulated membrane protein
MAEMTSHQQRVSKKWTIIFAVLALIGFIGIGVVYKQYVDLKNDPNTSKQAQENKVAELKAKVANLIAVPADETPTLATVTDKEKLKDQPFFKDAENGDAILIFPQAKKAIIYRESSNKLINVGPIAITSDAAAKTTTTTTTR